MRTQAEKAIAFQALHERAGAFIIPNPYDVGTARLLAHLGFEALATTSAGCAFALGQRDYTLTREQVLAHAREIVAATDLPVSADLEGGFGDDPKTVAETFRQAVATGLAGGSIEDSTGRQDNPIYEHQLAVERVRAAAEVVKALPFPFMLTARCENYLVGKPDLKDTIARLQAYQEAGAQVLYAPGLRTKQDITAVVTSVDRPVNVPDGAARCAFHSCGTRRTWREARQRWQRAFPRGAGRVPARCSRNEAGHVYFRGRGRALR